MPETGRNSKRAFCKTTRSNGGTRTGSCSAAAWHLEAHLPDGSIRPVAMAGTYLPDCISPFAAETLALEEVATFLARLARLAIDQDSGTEV